MLKRLLPGLCLLLLAACSSQNSGSSTPATTTPPATPASGSSAPATAASAPATSSTATAPAATPATAASAAPAAQDKGGSGDSNSSADAPSQPSGTDNSQWVEGKNYFVIDPRQPVIKPGKKINVTEVFSYGCPACDHAHVYIDQMRKDLPKDAVMTYLSAAFRPDENWVVYQRAYYAAKALGVADKSYDAMFDAVWKKGDIGSYNLSTGRLLPKSKWPGINKIATFYKQYGIDPKQFVAVAKSFSVNLKMKRADALVKAYGVQGTPTIVVDGRYRFDFSSAGSYQKGIELAKYLVKKAEADRARSGK